jgi:hypothetical protein
VAVAWTEREPEQAAAHLAAARDEVWLDRFLAEIDRRRRVGGLELVMATWALSQADVARLFGVSRQAIGKWLAGGAPAERAAAVADLESASELLVRYLRRDRIPAVVRRPAEALAGASLLDLAGRDPAEALAAVRAMFDFRGVHA